MDDAFKRNRLIEGWRKEADEMATRSAAIADFLRENINREGLDPAFVNEQLMRLADGQASLAASLRALGSVMAASDLQVQKLMKAMGIPY